jgi:hypothetical protein
VKPNVGQREASMTEAEWLACDDPEPMLEFLRGTASDRKLRLFSVACCQRLLQTVRLHPWYAYGLAVAERFADGEATVEELEQVCHYPSADWCLQHASEFDPDEAAAAGQSYRLTKLAINACWNAMDVGDGVIMADSSSTNAAWAATQPGPVMPDDNGVSAARLAVEQAVQAGILRDIVGNPFRPVSVAPATLTPIALSLAQAAYDERGLPLGELDPARLAILADALEESNCTDDALLSHLRSPGPHVRGCWALDLILGKK